MKRFLPFIKIHNRTAIITLMPILFIGCGATNPIPKVNVYDGELNQYGKYHGKGVLTYPNGHQYVGEFKDGKINGYGIYTWPDGEQYVGEFKDGKNNGQGTFTWPDGKKYVGEFKDGKYNGQGTFTWPDGKKYIGELKDSKYSGAGVLFKVDGEIQSGTWAKDIFQQEMTIESVNNYLKNNYPQFKGLNYETPTPVVSLLKDDILVLPPPEKRVFIAVVDFTGNNVSVGDCQALTDRLRAELFNIKYYNVIEREMMDEIISEQGFQQSGCTTDECMVQVGKLIGVEQIVGGSISKVGSTYSVSARMVSIETGDISKISTYDFRGEIDDLLISGMKEVALQFIR